jgi:TolA-binding protein
LCLGNHERALKAYESIMENFPQHAEIPNVMLKVAMLKASRHEHEDCAFRCCTST